MANTPTTCPLKSKVWTALLVLAVLPFALRRPDHWRGGKGLDGSHRQW